MCGGSETYTDCVVTDGRCGVKLWSMKTIIQREGKVTARDKILYNSVVLSSYEKFPATQEGGFKLDGNNGLACR